MKILRYIGYLLLGGLVGGIIGGILGNFDESKTCIEV